MKRLFLLAFLYLHALTMSADVLKGRVIDSESKEPLEQASITLDLTILDFDVKQQMHLSTDSVGRFGVEMSGMQVRVTLKVNYFGYHQAKVSTMLYNTNDTVDVGTIELKPSEELLKEVNVNAKMKRFYMKGDTVVFNPEAFHLEEGDRLIALVEKLPGVSVKDGHLLWNGEPLKIMMNGKGALSENMLLNQLPVEAVDKIKAYDQTSELQDRTGVADGNQQHVLDVTIKPGFMDKVYATIEAKAYAGKEYAASVDATKLSDNNPFMLYGRIADDIEKNDYMTMNGRGYGQSPVPVRQQVGAMAYRHLWKPQNVDTKRDNKWDITAGVNHWDESTEGWNNQQTFIPGTATMQNSSTSRSCDHNLNVPVDFTSYFNLGEKNTLSLDASLSYTCERKEDNSEQETQSLDLGTKVNASSYKSLESKEGIKANGSARFTHYLPDGSLSSLLRINYENMEREGTSIGEYQYFQNSTSRTDRQQFNSPNQNFTTAWLLEYNKAVGRNVTLHGLWETSYNYRHQDESRWRGDKYDFENSMYRQDDNWNNLLMFDANFKSGSFSMKPVLKLMHQHEQTDYRRAVLDTLARRNLLQMRPSLELSYRLQRQMNIKATLAYNNSPADLIDCIGYVDDTNPLYVRMGNPDLKTSHSLNAGLLYTLMLTKHSQSISLSFNYQKTYDPIGMVMHYNSQTGGYIVQKHNVRGGNLLSVNLAYERDLTDNLQFKNTISGGYDCTYGITTMVDDATGLTYNRQNQSLLKDNLNLLLELGNWSVYSFNIFSWNRYAYSSDAQITRNILNYTTELRTRYKYNKWKFSLSPEFVFDHGYESSHMNGGQFLLNAQVDYSFLKNRAQLVLYAHDLLNQQKHNFSTITATTHTEGGKKFMNQYVSLTFKYRLDPK